MGFEILQRKKQTGLARAKHKPNWHPVQSSSGNHKNLRNDEENVSGTGPPRELCTCPLPQALSTFRNLREIVGNSFCMDVSALDLTFGGFMQTTHLDLAIKPPKYA